MRGRIAGARFAQAEAGGERVWQHHRHAEAKKFAESNSWPLDLAGAKALPAVLDKEYARLRKTLTELGIVQ